MNFIRLLRSSDALTFAELETLASLGLTGLFALYYASIASHKAFGTKSGLDFGIVLNQSPSNSEAQSLCLTLVSAAVKISLNIKATLSLEGLQRLFYYILQDGRGEINFQRALVDGDIAGSLGEVNACYRSFTTAYGIEYFHLVISVY